MPSVGPGVREIRVRDDGNAYRSMYVTNIDDAMYVLHVFVKKSRRTTRSDVEIAKVRLNALRSRLRRRK